VKNDKLHATDYKCTTDGLIPVIVSIMHENVKGQSLM